MNELESSVEDLTATTNGIPMIWGNGRKGEELKEFYEYLKNGMNYWNELRNVLRKVFRENRTAQHNFDNSDWSHITAYRLGYERALQDVYKILPRPKE